MYITFFCLRSAVIIKKVVREERLFKEALRCILGIIRSNSLNVNSSRIYFKLLHDQGIIFRHYFQ